MAKPITITDRAQLAATRRDNPDAMIVVAPPGEPRYLHEPGQRARWLGIVATPIYRRRDA